MGTDKPILGSNAGAGMIDVERAVYTHTSQVAAVNRYLQPNYLIAAVNRLGQDISSWTRSTWSSAPSALSASWARSTWSCTTCTAFGGAIDPQRSTWSRSTWSSAGEDASAEAAQYAEAAAAAEETGSLDAPIPTDAVVPTDEVLPIEEPTVTEEIIATPTPEAVQ